MSYKQVEYIDYIKNKIGNKKLCIYPMGVAGKLLMDKFQENRIEVDYFADKNIELADKPYKGKQCLSQDALVNMNQDEVIVIIESIYYKEIRNELRNRGIKNILRVFHGKIEIEQYLEKNTIKNVQARLDQICDILKDEESRNVLRHIINSWFEKDLPDDYFQQIYCEDQYIVPDIVKLEQDEIFVDAGAYTGDTAEIFMKACNGKFKKMHLFELDPEIYTMLCENMLKIESGYDGKIVCHPFGLFDKNETISIVTGDRTSKIYSGGVANTTAEVRCLDSVLESEKITFLKMDVEGAELNALKGAEKTIKKYLPKLAISIYHKPEDYFEIPVYIKKLSAEYDLYIRHHTEMEWDTVCYAIPKHIQ